MGKIKKIDKESIRNDQIPHEVMVTVIPRLNEVIDRVNQISQDSPDQLPTGVPYSDRLHEQGIVTIAQLQEVNLTQVKGIGPKRAGEIKEWLEANV